jgi:hypothetical protein
VPDDVVLREKKEPFRRFALEIDTVDLQAAKALLEELRK